MLFPLAKGMHLYRLFPIEISGRIAAYSTKTESVHHRLSESHVFDIPSLYILFHNVRA